MSAAAEETAPRGLVWAFSVVASLAIHTTLAAALLTAAGFASSRPPETQVSISTVEAASLAASAPPAASAAPSAASAATALRAAPAAERLEAAKNAPSTAGEVEPERLVALGDREAASPATPADTAIAARPEPMQAARPPAAASAVKPEPAASVAQEAARDSRVAEVADVPTAVPVEPASAAAVPAKSASAAASPVESALVSAAPKVRNAVQAVAAEDTAVAVRQDAAKPVERGSPAQAVASVEARPSQAATPSVEAAVPLRPDPATPVPRAVARMAPLSPPPASEPPPRLQALPGPATATATASPGPASAPSPSPAQARPAADIIAGLPPASTAPSATDPGGTAARAARIGRFLRGYSGGSCFLAVSAGNETDLHLRMFAGDTAAFSAFLNSSAGSIDAYAEPAPVGAAQCLALGFARSLPLYPDFKLQLELDTPDVVSGAALTGRLLGDSAGPVYLLLVDDEGMVQRTDRFLTGVEAGWRRFSVPMVLTDTPKTPTQLLIAVSAARPVQALEGLEREAAAVVFKRLRDDPARAEMDFAIVAFVVRRL